MNAFSHLRTHPLVKRLLDDEPLYLFFLLVLAAGFITTNPFHPDFAGGQTITAKYLAGERPYIDIIENNPPMTFYMHVPSAYLEILTGIRGEIWQNMMAFALCLGVIGLGEWLRTGHAVPQDTASAKRVGIFLITLLIMPMTSFGSRDQLTFVLIWPLLALYAEDVVKRRSHPAWVDIGIGLLAGLGACIKFYFVLGPVFACLYLCRIKRSFKPLFGIENITATTVCLVYLASIKAFHPAYLDFIYPMLKYTYFAGHPTLLYLVMNGLLIGTSFYLVMELAKNSPRLDDPRTKLLLVAAMGFSACYFLFARNLPFRYLPPASCIFMALAAAQNHDQRPTILKAWEVFFIVLCSWYMLASTPQRPEALQFGRSLRIEHPKILLLSRDLGDGQPLIRDLGGKLVNPGLHPWVTIGVTIFMEDPTPPELQRQFMQWINWERDLTAKTTQQSPPDVILIDDLRFIDWREWARGNEVLGRLLDHYKEVGMADNLHFLVRKTPQ